MNSLQYKFVPLVLFVLLGGASQTFSQGTFQNLDFEAANIPNGSAAGSIFSTNAALPGWYVSGGSSVNGVAFDGYSEGGAFVSINDSNTPGGVHFTPLQGNYSVILFAGPDQPMYYSAISQTGLIPAGSLSVFMDLAFPDGQIGPFTISVAGQPIAMTPIQTFPGYTVYGGNIGAYAGQVETLSITQAPPQFPGVPPAALVLDDIVFSPQSVPEPGTWAILLGGAATLFATSRWRRKT